jgi:hypothetical protein
MIIDAIVARALYVDANFSYLNIILLNDFSHPKNLSATDKFYLSLLGSLAVMHVIDAVLDFFADLLRRTTSSGQEERR